MWFRQTGHLDFRSVPAVGIIDVRGSIDDLGGFRLAAAVRRLAAAGHHSVVANLTAARCDGVAGLGAVLDLCGAAARLGVTLTGVCRASSQLDLLVLAKLATCFVIYEDEAAAFAAIEMSEPRSGPKASDPQAA